MNRSNEHENGVLAVKPAGTSWARGMVLLLTAALVLGLAGAAAEPASARDGTVTITQSANEGAAYDVYQVFTADVADGEEAPDGTATNVKWASDAVKEAVTAYIASVDGDWDGEGAQDAAEYIGEKITGEAKDDGAGTDPATPLGTGFAAGLAKALVASGIAPDRAQAGQAYTAPQGLYLFVTAEETLGEGEAGSAAMWVPIGSSTTTIAEKTSTGTSSKQVKEDSTGTWGQAADANVGQPVEFEVVTALPDNIRAYSRYHWKLTDTLPDGMSIVADSSGNPDLALKLGDVDITGKASISSSGNVLTVDAADLVAIAEDAGTSLSGGMKVTLSYKAVLESNAVLGSSGNRNEAVWTHTADPVHETEVDEPPVTSRTYTYALELKKVDKSTGDVLQGARYVMQVSADNADESSRGLYVQEDGSLAEDPHEFETGEDGLFSVSGIDEGAYTIHETAAPAGYDVQAADISIVVTSTFDEASGELTGLSASLSGGETADDTQTATHLESATEGTGLIKVVASDSKRVALPLTGMDGDVAVYLAAAALASLSLAAYARSRRKADARGAWEMPSWRDR